MLAMWVMCALAAAAQGARAPLAAPASFDVESTVLLNDVARKDREVGYKIRAALDVAPVWALPGEQYLLQFRLNSPKLYLKGKHMYADYMPYDSVWDEHGESTFYAHWDKGLVQAAYLDPGDLPDILNYKKSLVSLFQFQLSEGERNETDITGSCFVLYETLSEQDFRKIKMRCESDSSDAVQSARRATRYTLSEASGLAAVFAEELLVLGHDALGLKARAWHHLRARPAPAPPAAHAALHDALLALPPALRALPLHMPPADADDADAAEELDVALEAARAATAAAHDDAGGGGSADAARAALRALPALRAASQRALAELLVRHEHRDDLTGLCRLLGLAGSRAAHAAAADFLQLRAPEAPPPRPAAAYLAAFALAPQPDDEALLDVLRLGEEARDAAVAEAALLAAGAAARRASSAAAAAVRDALALGLARCQDDACRAVRVRALGNTRRADVAEALLEQAERGARARPRVSLAALRALASAPADALAPAQLDRLFELALDESATLELRAAALDLAVTRRVALPAPLAPLARVASHLHERGPHELRRVLWQRAAALAPRLPALARLPTAAARLRGWDALAHGGSSAVHARDIGWAAGGRRASLDALLLANAGVLRAARVRLLAHDAADAAEDLLAVEVWTRGLEAFGGDAAAAEPREHGEPEAAGGGLELVTAGARGPEIVLFDGQAELVAHVWAGTASEPTPALRALLLPRESRGAPPLLCGVRVRAASRAALALALDARAAASLWWRTAGAALELRVGAAFEARAELRTAWGAVDAAASFAAEPRLRIAADLDFYGDVRLCVRAHSVDFAPARNVTLSSAQGARRLRVQRRRREAWASAGRTLSLGRLNDDTCRTLRSTDADADSA